jgi:hypothetical protein
MTGQVGTQELIEELDAMAMKVRVLRRDGWIPEIAHPLGELELLIRKLQIDCERRIR